mmetsp:Transcript_36050/g.44097  ORF Transcript_36050/g.44097 Transcript_36050/m.44097 type:complete len:411 (+) Transcript_36050:166-1398(+)
MSEPEGYDWLKKTHGGKKGSDDPLDWGVPGNFSDEEYDVFIKFQKEVTTRGGDFKKTIFSFGEEEGEVHALGRWLRARKFVYDDVITMVEQATEECKKPSSDNYYPDPKDALGIEPQIYISQYPQLYYSYAKSGAPVFISKPGLLNISAITSITTMEGILKYHWYAMIHDFGQRLRAKKETDPNFTKFQCLIVMDLGNLGMSQVTQRALAITKEQSKIDSLCFPETLERMVIVNAPRFFTATWKLIKGWLDARTSAKVELISSRSTWEKRLRELIEEDQLPSDYGGKADDTNTVLMKEAPEGCKRQFTELMSIRSSGSYVVQLDAGEKADITIFTRSTAGATFLVADDKKKTVAPEKDAIHTGGDDLDKDQPTRIVLAEGLAGPGKFKIKGTSKVSRMTSDYYFVVCNVF